ncbi:MAG: endonuclease/exonuclease/phosphatase family protein, partial [Roseburia sp.]|nr:endonuclease/exonuclease/phosphatase family protein [Roseburia sp.]
RKEKVKAMIKREAPDLIGFQEVHSWVWQWLEETLGDEYMIVGCGRNENYSGEGTPLAFRKSRFRMLHMDTFWLSDTPDVPGSRLTGCDQSKYPRMAVSVLLKDMETNELITFVNTHTDHTGVVARDLELKQVAAYLKGQKGRKIVTGDMNALPDASEITNFLKETEPFGMRDATADVGGTFHNFGRAASYSKIDYIFTDLPVLESHAVEDAPDAGVYYSDHLAVCSVIQLNDKI